MSRYAAAILLSLLLLLAAAVVWVIISSVIWRMLLRNGLNPGKSLKWLGRLTVAAPLLTLLINFIDRLPQEWPHGTILWAYIMMPMLASAPFGLTLVGLKLAVSRENQRS